MGNSPRRSRAPCFAWDKANPAQADAHDVREVVSGRAGGVSPPGAGILEEFDDFGVTATGSSVPGFLDQSGVGSGKVKDLPAFVVFLASPRPALAAMTRRPCLPSLA